MDEVFFKQLQKCRIRPRTVMDVGISAGFTTLDWLRGFESQHLQIKMIATDRCMSAYVAHLGAGISALIEPSGCVLKIEFLRMRISPWCSRRDFLTGLALAKKGLLGHVKRRLVTLGTSFGTVSAPRLRVTGIEGPFLLVAIELQQHPNVELRDDDILAETPSDLTRRADVIRLANLAQREYFAEHEIAKIAVNVRDRCRGAGSLVILCRERNFVVEGSILRLGADGQFVVQSRLAGGSEVEDAFLRLPIWERGI